MTGRRVQTALLGIVLAIVGIGPALAQDEPRVSFSTSVDYSVGDYGTGKDTTLLYVPFTLGVRPFDGLWLNVTVPLPLPDRAEHRSHRWWRRREGEKEQWQADSSNDLHYGERPR